MHQYAQSLENDQRLTTSVHEGDSIDLSIKYPTPINLAFISSGRAQGFICPICMEALRSAEALQVHWDAAHSNSGASAASATVEPATNSKQASVNSAVVSDGEASGVYEPQLPAEGSENELTEYKTLVNKMTETINVRDLLM